MPHKFPPIPGPCATVFMGQIRHPDLWLWDSWVVQTGSVLHLYCLALSRNDKDGAPILPGNDYYFHVRHFQSSDSGLSWTDEGLAFGHGNMADGSDAGNIWSGSVHALKDGQFLYGFTGIGAPEQGREFVQSVCFAIGSDTRGPQHFSPQAASHPVRDREAISDAGYYLPPAELIGNNEGEAGGPILAWRDPFIFCDSDGSLHAFWSAKIAPRIPAIAHAILKIEDQSVSIETLNPPILLPDADTYTQAEVPKIYKDAASGEYLMLIAACNRLHEQQPDSELSKEQRLYKSQSLNTGWEPYRASSSVLENVEHLFGGSITKIDACEGVLQLIAPYTTKIGEARQLSFEALKTVPFSTTFAKAD